MTSSVAIRLACLDQLALAREQLTHQDPANGRFAHILVDNAVELMVHYQAVAAVQNEWLYSEIKTIQPSDKTNALGREIRPKLMIGKKLQTLNEEEAEHILIHHEYRNEVYHLGIRHEAVIWDLALEYHAFACQLLQRIKLGLVSSNPFNPTPPRLRKYGATEGEFMGVFGDHKRLDEALADIGANFPPADYSLGKALANALKIDVDHVDEALKWIERHDGKPLTRAEILIENQLWSALFDEERQNKFRRRKDAKTIVELQREGVTHPIEMIRAIIEPPINKDPIPKWRARLASLASESSPLKCLKKYHQLRLDMVDIYEDTMRAGGALENHLEQLRGK